MFYWMTSFLWTRFCFDFPYYEQHPVAKSLCTSSSEDKLVSSVSKSMLPALPLECEMVLPKMPHIECFFLTPSQTGAQSIKDFTFSYI